MTSLVIFIERMSFFGAGTVAGVIYGELVGRSQGVRAERLRVLRAFDVAFGIITSGVLRKVQRRITGQCNDEELRISLIREVEFREDVRRWKRLG